MSELTLFENNSVNFELRLRSEIMTNKGRLVIAIHPTSTLREQPLAKKYYEELDRIKNSGYPILVLYEPDDLDSVIGEFRNGNNYFIPTVSNADARPEKGWDYLFNLLERINVTDLFVCGSNINFWTNVEQELSQPAQDFNIKFEQELAKMGSPTNVLPVQCLGSFMLKVIEESPTLNLHFTRALYPARFLAIGDKLNPSLEANLSDIPDLPDLLC